MSRQSQDDRVEVTGALIPPGIEAPPGERPASPEVGLGRVQLGPVHRAPVEPGPVHPAQLQRALSRAERGLALDGGEVAALLSATGADLDRLMALARHCRTLGGRANVITWSPKVFIPLTRLCRDRCHYCAFATDPASLRRGGMDLFLSPDEVLGIARAGAAAGCLEALFTLGDRPEGRWPAAAQWLHERGYDTTLEYLRAMAILVLEETGLLPHLNPGVMSWQELATLRPVAASMGLMLESASPRLLEPGQVHHGSPDKDPAVRLRTIRDAGRQRIPFTSGVLFGIGESLQERAESLLALRQAAFEHGGLQEVIVQNFRAKPDTPLRACAALPHEEHLAAVAAARLVLGPTMIVQAPPNLTAPEELGDLIAAGIDDWGGVSPVTVDHVNPECPWPAPTVLARVTEASGFQLRARLAVHPRYVLQPGWVDPLVVPHVRGLAGPDGLADPLASPVGRPWQVAHADEAGPPGGTAIRMGTSLSTPVTDAPVSATSGDASETFGSATPEIPARGKSRVPGDSIAQGSAVASPRISPRPSAPIGRPGSAHVSPATSTHIPPTQRAGMHLAATRPNDLLDPRFELEALSLLEADGAALAELRKLADEARRQVLGDVATFVVNRNINFSTVCYTGCRFCAFAQRETDAGARRMTLEEVERATREAWQAGATEICMQGGIDPKLPMDWYLRLAAAVKAAAPTIHLHAFSPMEVSTGAARAGSSIRSWLTELKGAGVDTIPGTAAEILDDDVRWVLTRGKLPASAWIEVVSTAHEVGLRSTSTMMYGHVDGPIHWLRHLRVIAEIQRRTGGFTEFVPLPFVHANSPIYLAGRARPGSTAREDAAIHAFSRLVLMGLIDHIQVSWVKLGDAGTIEMLQGGADDLGGTLMEESTSRMAGSSHGTNRTSAQLRSLAAAAGRVALQRTTLYGRVPEQAGTAVGH